MRRPCSSHTSGTAFFLYRYETCGVSLCGLSPQNENLTSNSFQCSKQHSSRFHGLLLDVDRVESVCIRRFLHNIWSICIVPSSERWQSLCEHVVLGLDPKFLTARLVVLIGPYFTGSQRGDNKCEICAELSAGARKLARCPDNQ